MINGKHYVIGVSVGMASLPSAIAILEQEIAWTENDGHKSTGFNLRHLERPALSITYPELVALIADHRAKLIEMDCTHEPFVVADITGTGKAIGQLLKEADLAPITVTITGGVETIAAGYDNWKIPKAELIGAMVVEFQTDRFKVAQAMELAGMFQKELREYRPRTSAPAAEDIAAWREQPQDDLLFAAAVALWRARQTTPSIHRRERPIRRHNGPHSWMSM